MSSYSTGSHTVGPRSSHAFPHIGDRRLPSARAAHNKSLITNCSFPVSFPALCLCRAARCRPPAASKQSRRVARRARFAGAPLGSAPNTAKQAVAQPLLIHPCKRRRTRRSALSVQPLAVAVQLRIVRSGRKPRDDGRQRGGRPPRLPHSCVFFVGRGARRTQQGACGTGKNYGAATGRRAALRYPSRHGSVSAPWGDVRTYVIRRDRSTECRARTRLRRGVSGAVKPGRGRGCVWLEWFIRIVCGGRLRIGCV
jgi:hypothetical protein